MHMEKVECPKRRENAAKSRSENFFRLWKEKSWFDACDLSTQRTPCPLLFSQGRREEGRGNATASFSIKVTPLQSSSKLKARYPLTSKAPLSGQRPANSAHEPCTCSRGAAGVDSGSCWKEPGIGRDQLASASSQGSSVQEEFLWICASDLLLVGPHRKRPRLLPPNRKMHVEVAQRQHVGPWADEGARSPVPPEYSHLVDTMKMAEPADISEVETFYRRFTPWPRHRGALGVSRVTKHSDCIIPEQTETESASQQQQLRSTSSMVKIGPISSSGASRILTSSKPLVTKRAKELCWEQLPPKKRFIQQHDDTQSCISH